LKELIKRTFADNLSFMLATLVYLAANTVDYFLTVSGIRNTLCREGNPIIQGYMDYFGVEKGLLSYKLLICAGLIIGMKALDIARKEGKLRVRIRAEHILYGGAILTASGGVLWLLH